MSKVERIKRLFGITTEQAEKAEKRFDEMSSDINAVYGENPETPADLRLWLGNNEQR